MGVLDKNGFRSNIAMIVSNGCGKVLLAKRIGQNSWQFPQGGIDGDEAPKDALFRELKEEIGLDQKDVEILKQSSQWFKYKIPPNLQRKRSKPVCIGQKQKWFYLKLVSDESNINLDLTSNPEFDDWQWVNYWYPISAVISFKKKVYQQALREFAKLNIDMERRLSE